jgi:hypothetical protein
MLEKRKKGSMRLGTTAQALANRQGEVGEVLENMAESAGETGGAAEKLRRLAQEARGIEKELRKGRISSELERQQEKFKSRMLETSRSLRERGYGRRREGRQINAKYKLNEPNSAFNKSLWIFLLKTEKKYLNEMDLSNSQRRILDVYYETLLTK